MSKRIFVGINLPAAIKDYCQSLQQPAIRWIKWMKADNFHITLNFLGDLHPTGIATATQILQEIVPKFSAFSLELSGIATHAEMAWLKVKPNQELNSLQQTLQNELRAQRVAKPERRGYAPHILLAKSKTGRRMSWAPRNFAPQDFAVEKIYLYESRLTPDAATHILLQSFSLAPKYNRLNEAQ